MFTNINPETGIRYGYISAQSIHPDILYDVIDVVGENLSFNEAELETKAEIEQEAEQIEEEARIAIAERGGYTDREAEDALEGEIEAAYNRLGYDDREDFVDRKLSRAMDHIYIEEPIIEFEYEGVKGRTSWLGGALNLWIFESPILGMYRVCSPCVPNAGNLDQPFEWGVLTYDVPADWRVKED